MLGSRRSEGSSLENCVEISPLESLLHRAWLQSHKPKVQRRISSALLPDVSVERRVCSQPSSPALSGIVSSQSGDQGGTENIYFHKTRLDASTVLVSRLVLPELKCYSQKTYIPRSVSLVQRTYQVPRAGYGSSQPLMFLTGSPTHSFEPRSWKTGHFFGATESEDSSTGSVDFEGPKESLPCFLDDIFPGEKLKVEKPMPYETNAFQDMSREIADLVGLESSVESEASDIVDYESCWADAEPYSTEAEMRILEKSSAYQAMEKEIAELISPNSDTMLDADKANKTEELAARMMMEAYACILSRHIKDVSISTADSDTDSVLDYQSTEADTILTYFDEDWKLYLQNLNHNSTPTSSFDFNRLLYGAGGGSKLSESDAVTSSCGNLTELLYRCAYAVNQGNVRDATDLLADLRHNSSAYGNAIQRVAHYFMEALVAKMSGTGEQLYTVNTTNCPSAAIVFKAIRLYTENCPFLKLTHFFTIKSMVDAFEGATRVHVVYYGIRYGVEFPSLIQQLSERPEGLPHLRVTGIDSPHPGNDPCLKIHETGRRLEAFAKKCGLPFEFVALAGSWESFTVRDMNLREDEVLAVCSDKLHTLLDETVMAKSPREVVLRRIRSMNPKVFVVVGPNGGFNAPFFMTRFRESVKHYSAIFEGLEISMLPDDPDRVLVEKEIFGVEILNTVACEGQSRVERAEPYRQWQNRLQRAGFTQLPFKDVVFSKIKSMMAAFHKDYGVCRDEGWFLMGIRKHIARFCSTWEPKSSQSLHQIL